MTTHITLLTPRIKEWNVVEAKQISAQGRTDKGREMRGL